jgi:hypothetical protein
MFCFIGATHLGYFPEDVFEAESVGLALFLGLWVIMDFIAVSKGKL